MTYSMAIRALVALVVALVGVGVSVAHAAPWLVSDPYPATGTQPTHCALQYGAQAWQADVPVGRDANGRPFCRIDMVNSPVGSNSVNVKAVAVDAAWGRVESPVVPFVFTRPGALAAPSSLGLQP